MVDIIFVQMLALEANLSSTALTLISIVNYGTDKKDKSDIISPFTKWLWK